MSQKLNPKTWNESLTETWNSKSELKLKAKLKTWSETWTNLDTWSKTQSETQSNTQNSKQNSELKEKLKPKLKTWCQTWTETFKTILQFLSRSLLSIYLQHNGYRTAHLSTPKIWLACQWLTTGIQALERPSHISPWSVQHQGWKMVCYHCRFSRYWRLQMVDQLGDFKTGWQDESSQGNLWGHHKHLTSVNLLLQSHQWDIYWCQTGRAQDNWPARPMYQGSSGEMPVWQK